MQTCYWKLQNNEQDQEVMAKAAAFIQAGEVVAFPTETVYGLGADALNTAAVAEVFAVKDRPSFDPLICHFANAKGIKDYTDVPAELQDMVDKLAKELLVNPNYIMACLERSLKIYHSLKSEPDLLAIEGYLYENESVEDFISSVVSATDLPQPNEIKSEIFRFFTRRKYEQEFQNQINRNFNIGSYCGSLCIDILY